MKVMIFHATAGHGHKKAADVIGHALLRQGLPRENVEVRDILDDTSPVFRRMYPATYYYCVKHLPGLWGFFYEMLDHPFFYALVYPLRTLGNRLEGRHLLREVMRKQPDVIVCTHFFSAELFSRARREGKLPKTRVIVQITDFFPHTFWVNRGTDAYWVMAEESRDDLIRRGVEPDSIHAGGMPVEKVFTRRGNREALRRKWNLDPSRMTVLLTSGSFGLGPTEEILHELEAFRDRVQCFVVCGNNAALKRELEVRSFGYPVHIFGFVDFMADLMEASDLMIAKPGGATTSESLARDIPMVVLKPIPGQEARNTRLLKERGASFLIEKSDQIRLVMRNILDTPSILEEKKLAMRSLAHPEAADAFCRFILKEE